MKLKIQASAMGISTSCAKYKVATMTTAISMALSVEDDELTADPPTNDAVALPSAAFSKPHRGVSGAGLRRLHAFVG
jgi:hypothetical protein